ncbi:hypothetical protein BU23DRAFT_297536 [Bimuria novae-zelandiae CBS 107.79]|uniref:Uncharacterized protein n=1 Tax=Bimuria novae-zelandiae CBS 107.79 TaxID=1447943 RepID=A0A6A5VJR0_9PLEO|nr:hypothetical protein BU23DRAFT_297536 [Bimuria novae-zelandiae CBS 107.79]
MLDGTVLCIGMVRSSRGKNPRRAMPGPNLRVFVALIVILVRGAFRAMGVCGALSEPYICNAVYSRAGVQLLCRAMFAHETVLE